MEKTVRDKHIALRNYMPFFLALALGALIAACATVPITGRSQLSLVSDSELMQMSISQYRQVLAESKLSRNSREVGMVRGVGARIAPATESFLRENGLAEEAASYRWEFNVIDDDKTVNAWAMPGGKIAFYTGILPICQNDTGVAVVMGHEIAHVVANHGGERMSQQLMVSLGGVALAVALSTRPSETQNLYLAAFGAGTTVGILLPYSRLQESEADRIGLILMARAGYDPRAAVPFWERMNAKSGGGKGPEFLSTHPAPESRIEEIQRHLPEAMQYYRASLEDRGSRNWLARIR